MSIFLEEAAKILIEYGESALHVLNDVRPGYAARARAFERKELSPLICELEFTDTIVFNDIVEMVGYATSSASLVRKMLENHPELRGGRFTDRFYAIGPVEVFRVMAEYGWYLKMDGALDAIHISYNMKNYARVSVLLSHRVLENVNRLGLMQRLLDFETYDYAARWWLRFDEDSMRVLWRGRYWESRYVDAEVADMVRRFDVRVKALDAACVLLCSEKEWTLSFQKIRIYLF